MRTGEEYAEYEGEVILISLKNLLLYNVQVSPPDGRVNMRSGPETKYDKVLSEEIPNGNYWGYAYYNGVEGGTYTG